MKILPVHNQLSCLLMSTTQIQGFEVVLVDCYIQRSHQKLYDGGLCEIDPGDVWAETWTMAWIMCVEKQ